MKKALILDLVSARIKNNDENFVEESDVSTVAVSGAIVRADSNGKIDADWLQGPLDINILPVADNGEVSSTELVRADDSRLGNPLVGGDLSGTSQSATVVGIRNIPVSATTPSNNQVLAFSLASGVYTPVDIGAGNASLTVTDGITTITNVTQLNVSSVTDEGSGEVTISSSSSSGSESIGGLLFLFERFT